MGSLLDHLDRAGLALLRANPASLAVVQVDVGPSRLVDPDRDVGAELPADVALRARLEVGAGAAPPADVPLRARLEVDDGPERAPARRPDHVGRDRGYGLLRQVLLPDVRESLVPFRLVSRHAAAAPGTFAP